MRFVRSEWYSDRNPFDPTMSELFRIGVFLPLKVKDAENRQVVIIRTAAHDPKKHKFSDVLKVSFIDISYQKTCLWPYLRYRMKITGIQDDPRLFDVYGRVDFRAWN